MAMRPPHRCSSFSLRPGFTLTEILVVLVIVASLTVVGLGAWRRGREGAMKSTCMVNLRNIGVAMHLHAQENNGVLPLTTHSTTLDRAWIYSLEEHLGKFDETRICPADPKGKERLAAKGTSYILNSFVFVPSVDAFGRPRGKAMNRLSNHEDPSRTLFVRTMWGWRRGMTTRTPSVGRTGPQCAGTLRRGVMDPPATTPWMAAPTISMPTAMWTSSGRRS